MTSLLKKFFFSTRLMAVLFIGFAIALAFGTFIESWYSTSTARIWIYNTTWFEAIMVFFVINFAGNIKKYRLFRKEKIAVLCLHLSWILIIIGAFVTRYISFEGLMPIREGATENVFYSDKTFLTALVDGEIDGAPQRKTLQGNIIATPEAFKGDLPIKSDFNGQPFTISYVGFIKGAKEGLVPDENGKKYLKIVEAGGGIRHDHYLEDGKVANIHNTLFALNKNTKGAINIFTSDSTYQIYSPFQGNYMRMADQFKGDLAKDSLQTLQLRSLYSIGNMQFVLPDPVIKGSYEVVEIPKAEQTKEDQDALILDITTAGETVQKKILGSKGNAEFSDVFKMGGLDFRLSYGSKVYELPFKIKLNDFIAQKYPGTENSFASFMSKVTVVDERSYDYEVFMNNILDHKGYRFFQSSFHPDEKGTVLSVSHDFWGTWITYIGYTLLYIGLIGMMFYGKTRFKDLTKTLNKIKDKKKALLALVLLFSIGQITAQEKDNHDHKAWQPTQAQKDSMFQQGIVTKEHAAKFARLVVQDDGGRMKPINTFASELIRKMRFENGYQDLNPDQVLLSMMLQPRVWYDLPFIALDKKGYNDSIRKIIGVDKGVTFAKATDFFNSEGGYKLAPYLQAAYATNTPNKFEKDFKDLDLRLGLLNRALSGEILKVFPLLNDENNKWISALEYRSGKFEIRDSLYANFVKNALPYYLMSVRKSKISGDYSEPDKLLDAFSQNQINNGAEVMPSENKIKAEIFNI